MHGSSNDPLQFCNAIYYWGETPVLEVSELEKEVLKTQKCHKDGCSFVFTIPTSKIPGVLYVAPTKDLRYWYGTFAFVLMICRPATYSPKTTTTRLGVEVYLFDRENLDLPFSSQKELVALLGDAAHPQSPMLGQGVNMANTDVCICATRIAFALKNDNNNKNYDGTGSSCSSSSIPSAIAFFDTSYRRE